MESKKLVLLVVAVVAIGTFALPTSVSLFSGQHSWYDLSAGVNDVPCEKCHAEIGDEMGSSENGVHRNLTCAMCHRTPFTDYTYGSGYGSSSTAGKEAHAATVVQCMDCHDGAKGANEHMLPDGSGWDPEYNDCFACHKIDGYYWWSKTDISAGGFDLTPWTADTGEKAAHMKFVLDAMNNSLMEGANEACIACHTRIGVNITWTKNVYLDFNASEDEAGNWTIPSFTAGGENVTHSNTSNNWTKP
ncbi:MAG: cytochrome c3 family protein [Halobacteriota archaeon]